MSQSDELKSVDIPDNSVTVVLKAGGKLYPLGADIGVITPETPDEDLDSTLRAINGLGITLQRTIAVQLAGREETYQLPGDVVEQDLAPLADKIADVELAKSAAITNDGRLAFAYGVSSEGIIDGIVGDLDAAEKAGIVIGQPAPDKQA